MHGTQTKNGTNSASFGKSNAGKKHEFREEIEQCYDSNGYLSWSTAKKKYVILGTSSAKGCLVQCPECKFGHIQVVRSPD